MFLVRLIVVRLFYLFGLHLTFLSSHSFPHELLSQRLWNSQRMPTNRETSASQTWNVNLSIWYLVPMSQRPWVQFTWPKNRLKTRLRIRPRLNFDSMTCLNYLLWDFFQYRKSQADSHAGFQAVFWPCELNPWASSDLNSEFQITSVSRKGIREDFSEMHFALQQELRVWSGILFNSLAQPSAEHRDEGWRRRRRRHRRRPRRPPQPQGHRVRRRGRSETCCRNCRFVSSFTFNLVFTKVGFFNLLYMIQS